VDYLALAASREPAVRSAAVERPSPPPAEPSEPAAVDSARVGSQAAVLVASLGPAENLALAVGAVSEAKVV